MSEADVLLVELDRPDWPLAALARRLDEEERERAIGLAGERQRRRFVIAHALRHLLGEEGIVASSSRSGGLAIYALADGVEVGADIELVRPVEGLLDVAFQLLPPSVHAELAALPPARRPGAFATWWTRAEACVKTRRDGLTAARRLELAAGGRALTLPDPGGRPPVVSQDLAVGASAAAALAAAVPLGPVTVRRLEPARAGAAARGSTVAPRDGRRHW